MKAVVESLGYIQHTMIMVSLCNGFIVLCLVSAEYAFMLDSSSRRSVTKVLTVGNGGPYGNWGSTHYCDKGTFAVGYKLRVEPSQGSGDDTALNAILLQCEALNTSRFGGEIGSWQAPYGSWRGPSMCDHRHGVKNFLSGFALQVEGDQGGGDDTTANYAKFQCRDFHARYSSFEMSIPPGHFDWGGYGSWSQQCGRDSAICGIQTRVELPLGGGSDDTALNNAKMYCCSD